LHGSGEEAAVALLLDDPDPFAKVLVVGLEAALVGVVFPDLRVDDRHRDRVMEGPVGGGCKREREECLVRKEPVPHEPEHQSGGGKKEDERKPAQDVEEPLARSAILPNHAILLEETRKLDALCERDRRRGCHGRKSISPSDYSPSVSHMDPANDSSLPHL